MPQRNYDLFISYSRDPDYWLARHLESFLEDFHRLEVVGTEPLEPLKVCLDGSDFSLARVADSQADVESLLTAYLEQCDRILVLCSPGAAISDYVDFELRWFLEHRGANNVLVAMTELADDPTAVMPDALIESGLSLRPWYDFRDYRHKATKRSPTVQDFDDAKTGLAADLMGRPRDEIRPAWFRERQAASRRRVRIASLVAAGAIGLAIAAVYFGIQSDILRKQSEQRLENALTLARSVQQGIDRDLRSVQNTAALRERLLSETDQLLTQLSAGQVDDRGILLHQAANAFSAGQLAYRYGDLESAEGQYQDALRLLLRTEPPLDLLSSVHTGLGLVDQSKGRTADAESRFRMAIEMLQQADQSQPGALRNELSAAQGLLGALYLEQGDMARAMPLLEEAVAQHSRRASSSDEPDPNGVAMPVASQRAYESMVAADPKRASQFASTVSSLAQAYAAASRIDDANRLFEWATRFLRAALNDREGDTTLLQTLAINLSDHAQALAAVGEDARSWSMLQEEHDIWVQLAESEPDNPTHLHGLAVSYERIGVMLFDYRDFAAARVHFERQVDSVEQLLQLDPGRTYAQVTLAHGYQQLRRLSQVEGKRSEAITQSAQAIAALQQAYSDDQSAATIGGALEEELLGFIDALLMEDRRDEASEALNSLRSVYVSMLRQGISESDYLAKIEQVSRRQEAIRVGGVQE